MWAPPLYFFCKWRSSSKVCQSHRHFLLHGLASKLKYPHALHSLAIADLSVRPTHDAQLLHYPETENTLFSSTYKFDDLCCMWIIPVVSQKNMHTQTVMMNPQKLPKQSELGGIFVIQNGAWTCAWSCLSSWSMIECINLSDTWKNCTQPAEWSECSYHSVIHTCS